jgi:tol-pal system protein YbgF
MSDMKTSRPLLLILAAAAQLCLSPAAQAQDRPDDSYLRDRLSRMEKQLNEVRSIVLQARATGQPVQVRDAGPDPQVAGLQSTLDDLSQTVRGLTGQVEGLVHDRELARKQLADLQAQTAALSDRVDRLEKAQAPPAPAPAPPPAGPSADAAPAGEDAKAAYAHAYSLLMDGDYPAASTAFQSYIDSYGDTLNAPHARYWLGQTKYIQGDYAGAATALIGAVRGWPHTTWAPDAVVKLSLALVQLKKPADACRTLGEFERHYPKATTADKGRAAAARVKAGCAG